jgi:hypothetical protein
MACYVRRDGQFFDKHTGEPMEIPDRQIAAPMVMSDTPAYLSPLGTGLIDGRRARAEDLKRANCRPYEPGEFKPNDKFLQKRDRERFNASRA